MSRARELRQLIEECSDRDLSPVDEAVLTSALAHEADPETLVSYLDVGLECEALLAALIDGFHMWGLTWQWNSSLTLVEALLANGMDSAAETVVNTLRKQRPRDVNAARLWALCASDEAEVIRRFAKTYGEVDDRPALEHSVREFASKSHVAGLEELFVVLVRGSEEL